jgi:transcription initiation factor TFIID TATA-box-binding protein
MSWTIVNVVSTADLNQSVDIWEIAELPHTIHDLEIYGGSVTYLKTPEMYGKVTIFPTGKLISVGTKSPIQAEHDLHYTKSHLFEKRVIKNTSITINLRNLVATLTLPRRIDLEQLADHENTLYEPEQFPGAIIKTSETDATFLVFASGKIVIAGAKTIEAVKKSVKIIEDLSTPYFM